MKSRYLKLCLPLNFFFWAFVTLASGSIDHLASSLSLKNPQVYSQKYITGGQPNQADFKKLADAGLEVVINLRGEGEFSAFNEKEVVEQLGMQYISIPVASGQDLNAENIKKFHQSLSLIEGQALVHCASGNRVGAFFALKAYQFDHKSADQAIYIGKQTGLTRLENYVKKVIQSSQTLK